MSEATRDDIFASGPMSRSDAKLLGRMAKDKEWLARITPELRKKIVGRVLEALDRADADDVYGQRVIGQLASVVLAFDRMDYDRFEKAPEPPAVQNNTMNVTVVQKALETADGRAALSKLRDIVCDSDAAVAVAPRRPRRKPKAPARSGRRPA